MEVLRGGALERFLFPCPVVCNHLSDTTKRAWAWDADRSSTQAKLDCLVRGTDGFVHEMRHHAALARMPGASLVSAQFEPLKVLSLALAVAINALLLLGYGVSRRSSVGMSMGELQVRARGGGGTDDAMRITHNATQTDTYACTHKQTHMHTHVIISDQGPRAHPQSYVRACGGGGGGVLFRAPTF